MHRGLAFTMLLALAAAPAAAADWAMQPGSWLEFETSYDGEAFAGRFGRFAPMLRFDPATLDDARFDVRIDLARPVPALARSMRTSKRASSSRAGSNRSVGSNRPKRPSNASPS